MTQMDKHTRLFHRIAPVYNFFFNSQKKNYQEILERHLDLLNLPPGGKVLDIGCGTGAFLACFARLGYCATGVDAAEGMLKAARSSTSAFDIDFVQADATTGYPDDLARKVAKAKELKGMRFILVLTPCLDGWGLADSAGPKTSRLAVESGIFPLYEVEDGVRYTLNYGSKGVPVGSYFSLQSRFKHLSQVQVDEIQTMVDENWRRLQEKF